MHSKFEDISNLGDRGPSRAFSRGSRCILLSRGFRISSNAKSIVSPSRVSIVLELDLAPRRGRSAAKEASHTRPVLEPRTLQLHKERVRAPTLFPSLPRYYCVDGGKWKFNTVQRKMWSHSPPCIVQL